MSNLTIHERRTQGGRKPAAARAAVREPLPEAPARQPGPDLDALTVLAPGDVRREQAFRDLLAAIAAMRAAWRDAHDALQRELARSERARAELKRQLGTTRQARDKALALARREAEMRRQIERELIERIELERRRARILLMRARRAERSRRLPAPRVRAVAGAPLTGPPGDGAFPPAVVPERALLDVIGVVRGRLDEHLTLHAQLQDRVARAIEEISQLAADQAGPSPPVPEPVDVADPVPVAPQAAPVKRPAERDQSQPSRAVVFAAANMDPVSVPVRRRPPRRRRGLRLRLRLRLPWRSAHS